MTATNWVLVLPLACILLIVNRCEGAATRLEETQATSRSGVGVNETVSFQQPSLQESQPVLLNRPQVPRERNGGGEWRLGRNETGHQSILSSPSSDSTISKLNINAPLSSKRMKRTFWPFTSLFGYDSYYDYPMPPPPPGSLFGTPFAPPPYGTGFGSMGHPLYSHGMGNMGPGSLFAPPPNPFFGSDFGFGF